MKTLRLIALLFLFFCGEGTARAGFSFSLDPTAGVDLMNLQVGQTFKVLVDVAGVSSTDPISYFQLTESLGGTLFQLMGIAAGSAVPDPSAFTSNGSLSSFEIDYRGFTPITTPGTLAVVTLTATRVGSGTMALRDPSAIGPLTGNPIDFSGLVRDFEIVPAAIPEPSSLVLGLIAGAMGGLIRWGHASRSAA